MRRSGVWKNGRYYWHQHFESLSDLVSFFPGGKTIKDRVNGSSKRMDFAEGNTFINDDARRILNGQFNDSRTMTLAKRLEEFTVEMVDILIKNTRDLETYVETDLRFGSRFNATQYILGSETPFSMIRESDDALHGVGKHVTVWINTEMLCSMSEQNLFWLVASGVAVCKILRAYGYNTQICGYTLGYSGSCDAMQTYEIIPFGEEFDYPKIVELAISPRFLGYVWNGYIECPQWKVSHAGSGRSLRGDEPEIYSMHKDIVMESKDYDFDKERAVKNARENLERYLQR